jgi:putative restriction endonuclease
MSATTDLSIRKAAFEWLAMQVQLHGDVLPRAVLEQGFVFGDQRIPLLGSKVVFTPEALRVPLSIHNIPVDPDDDGFAEDGALRYPYWGNDRKNPENTALREAHGQGVPLAWFHPVVQGKYLAVWPAYLVEDDPASMSFRVEFEDTNYMGAKPEPARRAYLTAAVRQRIHDRAYRERVLNAYDRQCALCRLRLQELLDVARIVPDAEGEMQNSIGNGIALCKLHHAAFNMHFLTVRPEFAVEIRQDILDASDGPMLLHGLKEMHRKRIIMPKETQWRPNVDLLRQRLKSFEESLG